MSFLNSPKGRKISAILLLTLGVIIAVVRSCSSYEPYDSPKIMVCGECGYRQQLHYAEKMNCPKCNKEMGYLWKCMECRNEFECSLVKARDLFNTEEEFRKANVDLHKCPNCGSVETFLVTTLNMPEKTSELTK